ncbi:protein LONGIFOLIA 1 [Canna indica]|uniref:Protein LONGIFOLIA 1 n=1 Tax=Canna indica TaxID=4628 RepID=A0AAQ3K0K3_9LILI|nr:protein LONGIFOLIA 1 [Canna indica]
MSAKFLHSIADEHPELRRQIGCMTGIFQMFDRQHLLTGRRLSGHNHKSLSSGHALSSGSSIEADRNGCSPHIVLERSLSKSINDNQIISVESPRTSFSSSSCSSFSSLDCNKSAQEENLSIERNFYTERSTKGSSKLKNHDVNAKSTHNVPQGDPNNLPTPCDCRSLDFKNVVKDSIYKDAHALSLRTSLKEDMKNYVLKHKDSPRPIQLSRSMDISHTPGVNGKSKLYTDLDEPIRVLVKLNQAPQYFSEANEPPRRSYEAKDTSLYSVSKETPRFSYDGRHLRPSLDSRENSKISSKLRELPRLSLDSKECSLRNPDIDPKSNTALKEFERSTINRGCHMALEYQQELGSSKRPPSVVAKLMGLEAMPSLSQDQVFLEDANCNKSFDTFNSQKDKNFPLKKAITAEERKEDEFSFSQKCYIKDAVTPQHKRPHSVMKNVSNSWVPIEPAPWRHQNKIHIPENTTFGFPEHQVKRQAESVYSEIEKRLKDLEFQQSNKDLRALKHILDAMHAKGLLDTEKGEDQLSRTSFHNTSPGRGQKLGPIHAQTTIVSHPTLMKGDKNQSPFESPIVIMKPARSFNRLDMPPSSVVPLENLPDLQKLCTSDPIDRKKASLNIKLQKDQTPKVISGDPNCQHLSADRKCRKEENSIQRNRTKMSEVSPRPQVAPREDDGSLVKTSHSLGPKLQQKKLETEKRSRFPRPSSQSNHTPPKQPANRSSSESVSPRVRLRRKSAQAQQNDDQLSDTSSGTRSLNHQSDQTSLRSDDNVISASHLDVEVTSSNRSADLGFSRQNNQNSSGRTAKSASQAKNRKKKSHVSKEDVSAANTTAGSEQPGPISVLDASLRQDDLRPARMSSNAFKDNEIQVSVTSCKSTSMHDVPSPNLSSGFNRKKFANIEDLVQKLTQLSSNDGEASTTDHIGLLCETQSLDHRYISEILLASGLLMIDLTSRPMGMPIQLHPSGHPINPDLFLVLEQTKHVRFSEPDTVEKVTNPLKSNPEKLHRKLVFDVVNELLIQKLKLVSSAPLPDLLLQVRKARFPSGQHLLKELCLDIEHLKDESFTANNGGHNDNLMSCEYILRQCGNWFNPCIELQMLVLDVERSIFRDLIDEVITGEDACGFQAKASRRQIAKC